MEAKTDAQPPQSPLAHPCSHKTHVSTTSSVSPAFMRRTRPWVPHMVIRHAIYNVPWCVLNDTPLLCFCKKNVCSMTCLFFFFFFFLCLILSCRYNSCFVISRLFTVRCGAVRLNRTAPHRTVRFASNKTAQQPHCTAPYDITSNKTAPHRTVGFKKKNPHRAAP